MSDASEVKRYDQVDTSRNYLHSFDMEEDSTGAWVKYDDHLAAIQKKDSLALKKFTEYSERVCDDLAHANKTIARQARVIEKYQQAVTRIWVSSDNCEHDMEPNTTMDFFRCEKCGIPSAFAAIEKEGAKDNE